MLQVYHYKSLQYFSIKLSFKTRFNRVFWSIFTAGHPVNYFISVEFYLGENIELSYPKVDGLVEIINKNGSKCAKVGFIVHRKKQSTVKSTVRTYNMYSIDAVPLFGKSL